MIPQMNVLHTSVNMFGSQPGQDPINHHAMPDKPYNNAMWHFQNRTTMPKPIQGMNGGVFWPLNSLGMFGSKPDQYPKHPHPIVPNQHNNHAVYYNPLQQRRNLSSEPSVHVPKRSKRLPIINPVTGEDITANLRPARSGTGTSESRSSVSLEDVTVSANQERIDLALAMSMQEMTLVEEANALASFNNLNHHSRHTEMCDERTVVSNELFQESERARLQAIERNTLLRRHERKDQLSTGLTDEECSTQPTMICGEIEEPNSDCSICCEDYGTGDAQTTLTCRHVFHPKCIKLWLKKSSTCPNCRQNVYVS